MITNRKSPGISRWIPFQISKYENNNYSTNDLSIGYFEQSKDDEIYNLFDIITMVQKYGTVLVPLVGTSVGSAEVFKDGNLNGTSDVKSLEYYQIKTCIL